MARPHRPPSDHLTYLAGASAQVSRLGPLALLRGAEARAPDLPRIGEAKLPAQDIATLSHIPSLAFPAATLSAIVVAKGKARIAGQWLGLTGPMGPLPLHLSEFANYERRYAREQPYGGFLDLLTGRMLQFFFRAWATASPSASADRPADDRFSDQVAALTGANDGVRDEVAFPRHARLPYAALFASPRSPAAIGDSLADLMRMPVRVMEYVTRWRDIDDQDRTRLGRRYSALGCDALAGGRIWTADESFGVQVRAADAKDYHELLPGGVRYALLSEALDAFAPPHLEWHIELAIASEAIRPASLGGTSRLGWSSWLGSLVPGQLRSDARLTANARRHASSPNQENTR